MNSESTNNDWTDEELDAALIGERGTVRQALQQARAGNTSATILAETLARYLDNTLAEAERGELEAQLADNPEAVSHLIALHRETKRILNPEVRVEIVEKHFAADRLDYVESKASRQRAAEEEVAKAPGESEEVASPPRAVSENG